MFELDDTDFLELGAQPTIACIEQTELATVRHDLAEEQSLELLLFIAGVELSLDDWFHVLDTHPVPDLLLQETISHTQRGLESELLTFLNFSERHVLVHLLQTEYTERDVAGFVAHHIPQQLLEQWFGRHRMEESEGGQSESFDHDLHAEVGHVPPGVIDDIIEQMLKVRVDLVAVLDLGVEVFGEDFDMASFVHDLGRCVVFGVDPRNGFDDLGGRHQCTLFAVQELAELPDQRLHTEFVELLVAPILERAAWFLGSSVDRPKLNLAQHRHIRSQLI